MLSAELQSVRREKVKQTIKHAMKSALYQQKLSTIPLQHFDLDRFSQLPLTTKEELRASGTFGALAVKLNEVCQYHESFGTTGEPTPAWFTQEDLERGGKQMSRTGAGLTPDDLVLIRFPYAMSLPAYLMQQAAWQAGAATIPVSSRNLLTPYPRVLELLGRLKATVMAGHPREVELLAETARLLGMEVNNQFPNLRAIYVAGELLSDERRHNLQDLWGIPVYNMYGSTETANISTMCLHGIMHVCEEDFLVEVLQDDLLSPAAAGERGHAVITTLSHQGSPLLRYLNGDVISVEPINCPCGDPSPKLVHYGRLNDRLMVDGMIVDAMELQNAVYSLKPAPDAWKAVEEKEYIRLLLDSNRSAEWTEEQMERQLNETLGVTVKVEIVHDGVLLDRNELVRNEPARKPAYIQKRNDPILDLIEEGRQLLKGKAYEQAKRMFEQAIKQNPNHAEAHAWLAACYGLSMETGNMLDKINQLPLLEREVAIALELDPSLPFARKINGIRLLNTPEMLGGDPQKAVEEFMFCLDIGLSEPDIYCCLGEAYLRLYDWDRARDAFCGALELDPKYEKAIERLKSLDNT